MHKALKQLRLRFFATIGAIFVTVGSAGAAEDSAWDGDARSAARLIAGAALRGSAALTFRAGVEIRLASGWKTYWRYPGDSGVPPRFDFSGSENVGSVAVLWPVPHRFTDDGGTSIGYKDGVIFPLRVTARDAGKPVTLSLKLDYAVCEKLCVPAEANAALKLAPVPSSHDAALAAAEGRVPKATSLGSAGPLSIVSVRRIISGAGKPLVAVDLIAPADVELFAEGAAPGWTLPVPMPAPGAPAGHRRFGFELDGLPAEVDPKGKLEIKLTAVAGREAIEVTAHLD
jgi:hypothetical protein